MIAVTNTHRQKKTYRNTLAYVLYHYGHHDIKSERKYIKCVNPMGMDQYTNYQEIEESLGASGSPLDGK